MLIAERTPRTHIVYTHGRVLLQAKDTGQYQEKDMHLKCLKISCPAFFVCSLLGWIRRALSPGLKPPLLCVQSTY